MSEDSILIEGKEYVSSDRAAKLVGYTNDYVGQLARAGKIEAKRIGRSWYIAQESITKHKLSVHYILTKPKKASKGETDSDEIPNLHIDKSPSTNNFQETDVSTIATNNTVDVEEVEFDLLPRLKEKKRDVLLHTDIRYEKVSDKPQEKVFKDDSYQNNNHIKSIPIRKPIKEVVHSPSNNLQKMQLRTEPTRHPTTPVGDIVVDGIRKPHINRHVQSSLPKYVRREHIPEHKKIRRNPAPIHEAVENTRENSKVVPVVGAIIVFTVFVVVYMFMSTM